jgi:tryptophanyl-tRNA synthetase
MKRILSGITPSGDGSLHIGNYLGAVKQYIELSKDHECFLMFADLHALTTVQNKKILEKNIENLILNEIALVGYDNPNIHFFRQSDIPQHSELTWFLDTVTPLGLLRRAHAYKDKLAKDTSEDDINVGLFHYPILMSADILLYQADLVPVGKDQKQHVEICRDIAQRFNSLYQKKVFTIPEPYIPEEVAVILGTDGQRKMSKSLGNLISIFESEETIKKQVFGTYTDPTRKHADSPGHIEGNMVFSYLHFFGEKENVEELKSKYTQGKVSDVEVKEYLFESLLKTFKEARVRYETLKSDKELVKSILKKGAAKCHEVASKTMTDVRSASGLTTTYSFFKYADASDSDIITIDQFSAVKERVGKVLKAENAVGSDKLIRLSVDFGDENRTIFTGVRPFGYTADFFQGKQFLFVVNLKPRKMMNEESQGMILAVDGEDGKLVFVSGEGMPLGASVR